MAKHTHARLSPSELSHKLNQPYAPTEQQAEVIGADQGSLLVVAGAGAGKTETMAARVVWLVANGLVRPDQVLGLTFTKKAASQLEQRIRRNLATLKNTLGLAVDEQGRELSIEPKVSTYDSYCGDLVSEYGLLLPIETTARLITETELYQYCYEVVRDHSTPIAGSPSMSTAIKDTINLMEALDSHLVDEEDLDAAQREYVALIDGLDPGPRQKKKYTGDVEKLIHRLQLREAYIPLVQQLRRHMKRDNVATFGQKLSAAARIAQNYPQVGYKERRKFRVVMLDEYQDTSNAQRLLLSSLFGGTDRALSVTAVGDPMQAIYGWRGATSTNLEQFAKDFPAIAEDGTTSAAPKAQLTTSWRNPSGVLELANAVSSSVLERDGAQRSVEKLSSRPDAGSGDISLGWFDTNEEEVEYVADSLARRFHEKQEAGQRFTGAVLVRKNIHIGAIAAALAERGIPYEIVGLAGLLEVPEVADVLAIATMLVAPDNNAAAMRVLCGPLVNLGLQDLAVLHRRAENIAGRVNSSGEKVEDPRLSSADPLERLRASIDSALSDEPDAHVGLVDAIADLGEPELYSEEGYRRLTELSSQLRYLRSYSLSKPLTEIIADIERVFSIRTEALVRRDPSADGSAGVAHLNQLAEKVAEFSRTPGASLPSMLSYFELAKEREDGFDRAEVAVHSDRVQLLTVHKSKGLEWDTVAVLHCDNSTYNDSESKRKSFDHWINEVKELPPVLRGDAAVVDISGVENPNGVPVLDLEGCTTQTEASRAIAEHRNELWQGHLDEVVRLFYVAITRTEHTLIVTGSARPAASDKEVKPFEHLTALRDLAPDSVVHWHEPSGEDAAAESTPQEAPAAPDEPEVDNYFPRQWKQEKATALGIAHDNPDYSTRILDEAATAVHAARHRRWEDLPANSSEISQLWRNEVAALIAEHEAALNPVVSVELSHELSTSDLVSLKASPEDFARRQHRPVPFKPNAYAKRGTALHQWIEDRFGATSLLDDDQLPGTGEEIDPQGVELEQLKQKFLASQWADRTPTYVEHPFEISIGGSMVRGRIDAIFHFGDDEASGWYVVDWKTGRPPTGADMQAAQIQLAVYRLAWSRLLSSRLGREIDPESVRAAFHYIAYDHTLEPSKLPDEIELAALMHANDHQS
ncbi:ATP-dependent DNA helicase UvrD1 [Corynebacterium ciconiae DSM 44920]|uniref:UvrD-helicase domain-containing protein n=1 Tax=Corynebacterium ciconiae TaxID=227319 RepID=UPI0003668BC3|nr:UvrD-helicase domain-containing protein [Corynebacterium ciconiae]WKD61776.1 ATP-dependent DNA helicase UvrD1 [Corynebacterium ciconiae DSM 44920]